MTPRPHHLAFAHRALPRLASADPRPLFAALAGAGAAGALRTLWERAGEELAPEERLPAGGLRRSVHTLPVGRKAVVAELPPPAAPREAYFVALVQLAPDRLRCFTLARSADGTALGEWADSMQLSYGAGPLPLVKGFLEAVEGRL